MNESTNEPPFLISKHPLYTIWSKMLRRCELPTDATYYKYGERGIQVCERWHDFQNFVADMGPRPSRDHSIERRNNDGNYEPGNCHWGTYVEQANNRRSSIRITLNGQTKTVKQWADTLNIQAGHVYQRLKKGWSPEDALLVPVITDGKKFQPMTPRKYEPIKRNSQLITFQGRTQTITQWAREYNLQVNTLRGRLNAKWSMRDALTQPLLSPKHRKTPAF